MIDHLPSCFGKKSLMNKADVKEM